MRGQGRPRIDDLAGLVDIPIVKIMTSKQSRSALVGLSGPTGAGKTTAGLHLRDKGFAYARYSSVVEDVARDAGMEPSRSVFQEVGRELHESRGQDWLGRRLLEKLPRTGCMVADGLRYPEDHAFMEESFGSSFCHLAIDAPVEARRRRYLTSRPKDDFDSAAVHQSESEVGAVAKLAHRVIMNDVSLDQFLVRVELVICEWLDSIGMRQECLKSGLGQFARQP